MPSTNHHFRLEIPTLPATPSHGRSNLSTDYTTHPTAKTQQHLKETPLPPRTPDNPSINQSRKQRRLRVGAQQQQQQRARLLLLLLAGWPVRDKAKSPRVLNTYINLYCPARTG